MAPKTRRHELHSIFELDRRQYLASRPRVCHCPLRKGRVSIKTKSNREANRANDLFEIQELRVSVSTNKPTYCRIGKLVKSA